MNIEIFWVNIEIFLGEYVTEYTENHEIVHFKWVNCTVCKLYLNKAVTKKYINNTRS